MTIQNIKTFLFGSNTKNTKVKVLFGIFRYFYENFLISKDQKFIGLDDRKLIKNAVMILFYDSSNITRKGSYFSNYILRLVENNTHHSHRDEIKFK